MLLQTLQISTKQLFPKIKFCHGRNKFIYLHECDCNDKCKLIPNIKQSLQYLYNIKNNNDVIK